jgi:hypothetical protein
VLAHALPCVLSSTPSRRVDQLSACSLLRLTCRACAAGGGAWAAARCRSVCQQQGVTERRPTNAGGGSSLATRHLPVLVSRGRVSVVVGVAL